MRRRGWFETRRGLVTLATAMCMVACTMQSTNRTMWGEEETQEEDVEVKRPKDLSSTGEDAAAPEQDSAPPSEPPPPETPTGPAVTGFTLINADNDLPSPTSIPSPTARR